MQMVEARLVVSSRDGRGPANRCHCERGGRRRRQMQTVDLVAHNKMCATVACKGGGLSVKQFGIFVYQNVFTEQPFRLERLFFLP